MTFAKENEPTKDGTSFLIYVSIAKHPFNTEQLRGLLNVTRRNNTAAGITGLLLYKDGKFMQLLEGQKDKVDRLFERIQRDPRHRDVIKLLAGDEEERSFAEFSMGFENLDDPSVQALPGYSAYLDRPLSADAFSEDPTDAQRLLRIFKRTGLSL
ncbi:MAG: BLUF domain-containing protein [Verrucomicrobiota bacterium]|nr:BLUF domain-containing protein [Verrucomicrobiota bacterium]